MDKEICYIDTLEFYSARTKNEIMSFVVKWIELQVFILSKVSQTQKEKKKRPTSHLPQQEKHTNLAGKQKKGSVKREGSLKRGRGQKKTEEGRHMISCFISYAASRFYIHCLSVAYHLCISMHVCVYITEPEGEHFG